MTCCKIERKYRVRFLVLLCTLQLFSNILALALPQYIVGKIPKYQAQLWEEGNPKLGTQSVANATVKVEAQIGLFESFINGIKDKSNREGLTGVFGFALISTIASFFTFLYTMQILWKCCCGCCGKCCKFVSDKLKDIAKTNFTSGVSGVAVASMIGFSAEDLTGEMLGSSSFLSIAGVVVALLLQVVQSTIKDNKSEKDQIPSKAEVDNPNFVQETV